MQPAGLFPAPAFAALTPVEPVAALVVVVVVVDVVVDVVSTIGGEALRKRESSKARVQQLAEGYATTTTTAGW